MSFNTMRSATSDSGASSHLTKTQATNLASGVVVAGASAYASYNLAKHNRAMDDIRFEHNRAMAGVNLKVNQYLGAVNRLNILKSTEAGKQAIQVATLKAIGTTEVLQAARGSVGGSAGQVLHDISRQSAVAESNRIEELDSNLLANQLQSFTTESDALTQVGIRSVGGVSGTLAVGSAAAEFATQLRSIAKEPV